MLELLGVSEPLLLDFLVTFSRFEYSLKRAGYLEKGKSYASPDWKTFGKELEGLPERAKEKILNCSPYLQGHPPKHQIVVDESLEWRDRRPAASPVQAVIDSVKTVRNNLFHGGKFPNPSGPVAEPARDQKLLEECLAVLRTLLKIHEQPCHRVATYFPLDA